MLVLSACSTPEESARQHLQKGKALLEKGEPDKALLELKASIQDLNLGESYYYLALVNEKQNNFKAMRENLHKSLELDATLLNARLKLAQLDLRLGNLDEAGKQADAVLIGNPGNIPAQLLIASIYLRQGKYPAAENLINSVLTVQPDNIEALAAKAEYLYRRQDIDQALVVINAVLLKNPDAVGLYEFKSHIDAQLKNTPAMIADFRELVRLDPLNSIYRLRLASIYARNGELPAAEAVLRDMATMAPAKAGNKLLLLKFLSANAGQQVGGEYQHWQADKDMPVTQMLELSEWMVSNGYADLTVTGLKRIADAEKDSAAGLKAQTLLAEIPFRKKQFAEADAAIDAILKQHPDFIEACLLKARSDMRQNKPDDAIALLNKLPSAGDKSGDIPAYLGLAYLQKKDAGLASQHFKQAIEVNPGNSTAFYPIYNAYMQAGQKENAFRLLGKALIAKPYEDMLLLVKAELEMQEKNWEEAENTVNLLALFARNRLTVTYLQASILQGRKAYDQAIGLCQQLLTEMPEDKMCMTLIARSYEAMNARDRAIAFFEAQHHDQPENLAVVNELGELYMANKDLGAADKLLKAQVQRMPKVAALYLDLAAVAVMQHQKPEAVREILLTGMANNPDDYHLAMALAGWYTQNGDNAKAQGIYEHLLEKKPDDAAVTNNLACLLLDSKVAADVGRGRALAEKFKDSANPDYMDTYAWSLVKGGDTEAGIKLLEALVARMPEFPAPRYHLAMIDLRNDNKPLAISELKQALAIAEKQHSYFDGQAQAKKLLLELEAATKK
ncbi:MAG: tetratricopeptide repeat protein [Methylococcales bacterium]|nr:tetratricopeptide repeat protein [Methylococcales bacterium]